MELTATRKIMLPEFGQTLSLDGIKKAMREAGSYFFEPSTMRAFKSRTYDDCVWPKPDGWVFITSEKHEGPGIGGRWINEPRRYTIRALVVEDGEPHLTEPEGHSEGFQKYASLDSARRAARKLTSARPAKL